MFFGIEAEVRALNEQQVDCQYLDVGGIDFHVSGAALTSQGQHMLSVLASDQFAAERDSRGYKFIDRDPEWFSLVLAYLREGRSDMPRSESERHAIYREARYFGLDALCDAAKERECILMVGKGMMQLYNPAADAWHAIKLGTLAPKAAAVVNGQLMVANADGLKLEVHLDHGPC